MSSEVKYEAGDVQAIVEGFEALLGDAAEQPKHVTEARMSPAYVQLVQREIEPADYARRLRAKTSRRSSVGAEVDTHTRAARRVELMTREAELRETYARAEHHVAQTSLRYRFSMLRVAFELVIAIATTALLVAVVVPHSLRLVQSVTYVVPLAYVLAATPVVVALSIMLSRMLMVLAEVRALQPLLSGGTSSTHRRGADEPRHVVGLELSDRLYKHRYRAVVAIALFCLVAVTGATTVLAMNLVVSGHLRNPSGLAPPNAQVARPTQASHSSARTVASTSQRGSRLTAKHQSGRQLTRETSSAASVPTVTASELGTATSVPGSSTSGTSNERSNSQSRSTSTDTAANPDQAIAGGTGGVAVSGNTNGTVAPGTNGQSGSTEATSTTQPAPASASLTGGTLSIEH
jgi:hypothetical protein